MNNERFPYFSLDITKWLGTNFKLHMAKYDVIESFKGPKIIVLIPILLTVFEIFKSKDKWIPSNSLGKFYTTCKTDVDCIS